MKTIELKGENRELTKTGPKNLRKNGKVPCVLYGKNDQPVHFHVEENDFNKLIFTPDIHEVNLDLGGDKKNAVLKAVQYHPVTDRPIHADFLIVTQGEKLTMKVPVQIEGTSPGVLQGGNLVVKMRRLRVKALPKDLPEKILLNIDNILLNQSIKVGELDFDNIEFVDPPNSVVLVVKMSRVALMADAADAEAAEAAEAAAAEGEEGAEGGEAAAPAAEGDGDAPAEGGGEEKQEGGEE